MTFRPMPILSILMIPGLAVLFWLGSWQWARYQEKLAQPENPAIESLVTLEGELGSEGPYWLYTTYDGQSLWRGYRVLDGCFKTAGGEPTCDVPVLVDTLLLFAIQPEADPEFLPDDFTTDRYRLVSDFPQGFLRPDNQPESRRWYTPDAPQMAADLGLENASAAVLAEPVDIAVVAFNQNGEEQVQMIENPYANPSLADDLPPSRHLGYALTWFGLALAMIGVYLALHIARKRLTFR